MALPSKVLVVEDDTHIRRLLRAALQRAAYAVIEAGTAREGLSLLDIDKPDAVLLDLGLPDRDGLELLARIRTALRHRLSESAERASVRAGEVEIDLAHRRVRRRGEEVHLSPKEYEVVAELAKRPDRVISHAQLLRTVWGPAHEARVDYLRIVVRNLRQKLELDPARPALIRNEPGVGYRLVAD